MIDALTEKCIRVLIETEKPITSTKIAKEIGMSVSSVKHNMGYVRKVVDDCGGELKSLPGKGFWILIEPSEKKELLKIINENRDKSYYFSYRKSYILGILFQNNSNYTIQIFADDLGVGKNVIIKDLDVIEKWLSYFDLKLCKTRNRGITVEGGEFDKRQAIIYNNALMADEVIIENDKPEDIDYRVSQRFYSYFKRFYPQHDMFELQEYLREAEDKLEIVFDDVSFTQLLEYIAVTQSRIMNNNIIVEPNVLLKCKINSKQYSVAKELIHALIKENGIFDILEAKSMASQFSIYGYYATDLSFIKESYYNEMAGDFVERLQRIILNKKILVNENLIEDIGNLIAKKKMQKSYQVINDPYFKNDIKEQMPSLYGIVMTNIQPLENKLKLKFTENDIAYIVMLISNAIEGSIQDLRIIVYNSFDTNTSKYIENKIRKSVAGICEIKMVRQEELAGVDYKKYDLIFTTTPCPIDSAIKLTRRISGYDLKKISDEIKKKMKESQEIVANNYEMFHESMILTNYSCKHKDEVIHAGFELLKHQGFVDDGFEQNMLQREDITPTAIGNSVAIPHVYKSFVKKSGIAVITLDHPIDWSPSDKAEVIFLIAIDFETKKEIYSFFAQFYELIDDDKSIEDIKKAMSSEEVLKIIKRTGLI